MTTSNRQRTTRSNGKTIAYLTEQEHNAALTECTNPAYVVRSVAGLLKTSTRKGKEQYGYKFPVEYEQGLLIEPQHTLQGNLEAVWVQDMAEATVFTRKQAEYQASLKRGAYLQTVPAMTVRQMTKPTPILLR